jgi:hypothetical protein
VSVSLRPLVADDAAWLDGWLAEVAAVVGYDRVDPAAAGASLLRRCEENASVLARIVVRGDDEHVGLIVVSAGRPSRGHAVIELVATPQSLARHGLGQRGAALVEDELRSGGVLRVYAPAPAVHGIAMYFWIRLGYRPLLREQWPCDRPGVAWLARDISSGARSPAARGQTKGRTSRTASKTSAPK